MMLFDVRGRGPAKRLTRDLDFDGDQGQSTICHTADKDGGLNEGSRANVSWTMDGRANAGF
jgi:hypothetical protein